MDRKGDASRNGGFLIVAIVLIAWVFIVFGPRPRLAANFADGVYYNPCCGSIVLSNGMASLKTGSFKYVIEKDKLGPYILPTDRAVSVGPGGLILYRGESNSFVRTDASSTPQWIDIIGSQASYRFLRRGQ